MKHMSMANDKTTISNKDEGEINVLLRLQVFPVSAFTDDYVL